MLSWPGSFRDALWGSFARKRYGRRRKSRNSSAPVVRRDAPASRCHLDIVMLEARILPSGGGQVGTVAVAPPQSETSATSVEQVSPVKSGPIQIRVGMSSTTPQAVGSGTAFPGQSLQDEYNFNPSNEIRTPPDAEGAVGPNHFAQLINGRFAVYTKTGTLVTAESLDQFWAGVQPNGFAVDPRILYDAHSGRWFAASRDTSNGRTLNDLLFAVSSSNDPSAGWTLYKVLAGTGRAFVDYDTLGVDDNGVYFGMTLVDSPTGVQNVVIFATSKAPLLSGGQVSVSKFYGINDMYPAPQAALNLDSVGPTDPAWFISSTKTLSGVAYRTLTWNGATPVLSSNATIVATPSYGPLINPPSLGGTMNIATNDQRLLMAVIRNQQLWTARTVGVDSTGAGTSNPDRDAAEFLELGLTATQASLIQSGRVFDSTTTNPRSYFYPSVAVNSLGYMVMGFSGSSAAEYVGAYATSRLPSDPLGSLQPVTLIKAGEGAYTITFGGIANRWGDYSTTTVDPTDDKTIWTDQEYAGATVPAGSPAGDSTSRWATWIASIPSPQLVTATALSSSPNPSAFGQAVTFTSTITAPGSPGIPTGTVDFTEGGTDLTPGGVTVSGGVATFSTSSLSLGSHTISAAYGGDPNFLASNGNDSATPQAVRTPTSTTVSSAPNPSVFGQVVTFTAVVSAGGAGTPTGTVDFTEGSTDLTPGGVGLINGAATFAMSFFSVGSHTITANYGGDGSFQTSTGDDSALPQLVDQALSLTIVGSSPRPSVVGQVVTVTATVSAASPGSGLPSGSVDFREGSTDLTPGGVSVSGGMATFATNALALGSHTITAVYSGDTNFTASEGNDSNSPQLVNQDATITVVRIDVNPSVYGQVITMTATISAASPGAGVPTGRADFREGSTDLTPGGVSLSGGVATFATKALGVGSHTITAVYSGDTNFKGSQGDDSASRQVVNQDASTTAVKSGVNPSVFGQRVTVTATVSAASPGAGLPSGSVDFRDGSTDLTSGGVSLSGGVATFATKSLGVGSHTITAVYNGDTNFTGSQGNDSASPQVVNKDASTTAVKFDVNPSVFGQRVTVTATVSAASPGADVPTGSADFREGSTDLTPGGVSLSGGVATFATKSLGVGSHTITAVYNGDTNFTGSQGNDSASPQVVNKDASTTAVKFDVNPSVFGQRVTVTAIVSAASPGAGVPTGSADFREGSTDLTPGGVSLSGGVATFATKALGVGSHTITAVYNGDTNFTGSQGNDSASPQVVNKDATIAVVGIDVNPSVFGQVVTMTATVHAAAPGAGSPTGNVTFLDGSATLGTASLDASTRATFSTSALSQGNHSIQAAYGGDGNFTGSTSRVYGEPVNRAATTVAITSSTLSSVRGQSVALTATISPLAPGGGTPTGTVTFFDGNVPISSNLNVKSAGKAILSTTGLSVGTHTITAMYSGDTNFQASNGNDSAKPQVVTRDNTQTTVQTTNSTAVFGQTVILTAIVSANLPGSGFPSGSVTFTDFGNVVGTATLSGGQATVNAGSLAMGNHSIKASYSGSSEFIASSSIAYGEAVVKGSTATALHSAPNPSTFGNAVTLTAVVGAMAPASGVPAGMVTFKDGTTVMGSRSLDSSGRATFSTASLSVGNHTISAVYGGDSHFTGSSDNSFDQTVTASLTAIGPTAANQRSAPVDANSQGSIVTPLAMPSATGTTAAGIPTAEASSAVPAYPALNRSATDHFFASTLRTRRAAGAMKLGETDQSDSADWLGTL
jgi:Bacterial Ig-like domain (group 3)